MENKFLQGGQRSSIIARQTLATVQSRIPMYHMAAFVGIVLCFPEETPEQVCQQSAEALGRKFRRSIRGSDLAFLAKICIFLVLPETSLEGAKVVQQRLEGLLASFIIPFPVSPQHIQVRRYEMQRDTFEKQIIEDEKYTDLVILPDLTISTHIQVRMHGMEQGILPEHPETYHLRVL
jgi:hypothetical protein